MHSIEKNFPISCEHCQSGAELDFQFKMIFQPIFDLANRTIFAHEALVRGVNDESAGSILQKVNEHNRYRFDQVCRVKAIKTAAKQGIKSNLSINFLPNAVYRAETCIRATLEAAQAHNFPHENIIFEITENEQVVDHDHLNDIITEYRRMGFKTAIDDFGAGYSGLNLLANFQPHYVKIDMALVRDIDKSATQQAIVKGIVQVCQDLGSQIIAEGVETEAELKTLRTFGIELFQGFFLARPADEAMHEFPRQLVDLKP